MERDLSDKVLSDVHVFTPHNIVGTCKNGVVCVSRFPFSLPFIDVTESAADSGNKDAEIPEDDNDDNGITLDEDGDMVVKRRHPTEDKVILHIEHVMETKLQDVGLQVWQGCLLLCDLVLHLHSKFKAAKVLDLGAGVGLTSIVAGLFASSVTVTDVGDSILEMAERNININKPILGDCCFNVKELDWCQPLPSSDGKSNFLLSKEDLDLVNGCDIILAAEVVYDPDLTEAFFSTVKSIMTKRPRKTLYMSLERRMVFTVDDLDVVSPAYDHFREKLLELESTTSSDGVTFTCRELPCSFPQYTVYDRHKYLELWEVVSHWPV